MENAPVYATATAVSARYKQLLKRIQQLPPVGSRPLTVGGRVSGWITGKATAHLQGLPGIHIEDEAVHIAASQHTRRSLNGVLADLAEALKDTGCLRSWRNELLDVYGEGRRMAVIERAAVRPLGLLTKAVHLNAWAPDGSLWVAKRSDTKSTDPGMWDTLVGGLATAGESLDLSLLRESYEEAGLSEEDLANRTPLRVIVRMHKRLPEGYQVEDALVSDCVLAKSVRPHNIDGEVSEIRCVGMPELWSMIQADAFTQEAELVILEGLQQHMGNKIN
ncbi:DUF4743 domain-containing protein [Alcaligenaceae bacterium]|nr:DUF4743 domain-containing protein [Alcaligenaceae bacterium]